MRILTALALALIPQHAPAQGFTTAAEVKPILEMIKPQWVAIRPFDGQDLLYFTTLLVYRCGITQINFSYNGSPLQTLDHEPCHRDEANPSALKLETHLPYVVAPLDSLQTITVQLLFDDGSAQTASYNRKEIQIN